MKQKTGLWKTESQKGVSYYKGKIKIGNTEYNIALFKNEKKQDKSPDLMLYIEEKQENKEEKVNKSTDEKVYEDFGNGNYDIKDEDLAF